MDNSGRAWENRRAFVWETGSVRNVSVKLFEGR